MQTKTDRQELIDALRLLVDAIDFEGEHGKVRFSPGGPFEDNRLRKARAVLEAAGGKAS